LLLFDTPSLIGFRVYLMCLFDYVVPDLVCRPTLYARRHVYRHVLGRELVAGTNEHSVILYDVGEEKVTSRVVAHNDDVNAVAFLDDSSNLIITGSDDELCKVLA
jgi:WD40 repeat protein